MISLIEVTAENFKRFQADIQKIEDASFPTPWTSKAFREEMRNPLSHVWAAKNEDKLLGYICFWLFAGEIHLMNIATHPDERGKGVAHYLLRRMIAFGASKRVQLVWLEVRPSNKVARSLYERAGFQEISRRPRYYTDTNEDAIVMALTLSGEADAKDKAGAPEDV